MRYQTLESEYRVDTEVKKSKFVSWAWPVSSPDDALSKIQSRSDPSASHNCWAYKIGPEYRSNDDGEPGGTAGRPILSSIESERLDHVCVLVTRYFGGIKLGTGGLVRAYGGAARACLREAPKTEAADKTEICIRIPFEDLGKVYGIIEYYGADRVHEDYSDQSSSAGVMLVVRVDQDKMLDLLNNLRDSTGGRVKPVGDSTQ